ncbi:hypothetical protein RQM65_03255 [Pricia sp. S334]|uniref:Uncharacterized protein n=1 Tax=Pricia mediterranea TaxID=3076079 RepID=A0ABU3L3L3_9FLAO|nr:hypothetical protein [Pricia sp. S334]MDT7827653.1 hypothetical protein [Pricia sp. S334]MDT7827682.1 hypothetical protein [Pricia sp. S334]
MESQAEFVVEFSSDCIGMEFINIENPEDCVSQRPFYLLWIKNGKYFKRKFSDCSVFKTIEMERSDFLMMSNEKLHEIKNAKLLPVIHKSKKNPKGEQEIVELDIDHFCESKFIFHKGTEKIEKSINHFYLGTEMIDENTPNDNYKLNQKSILGTIHKLIGQETME